MHTNTQQPNQYFSLEVNTDLEALGDVLSWFDRTSKPLLRGQYGWQCQLILVEGFTNAVRHAHHDLPKTTPIELEVDWSPDYLEIRILDWGQPFDLKAEIEQKSHDQEQPDDNIDALKEGGRGLIWIKKLTDQLNYVRMANQRNCLIMGKKLT